MNAKQKRFCQEYIVDCNGTQAAKRAGYSAHTAQEQSSQLLSLVIVKQYVKRLQDRQAKRTEVTADKVVAELAKLSFVDIGEYLSFDGNTVTLHSSDDLSLEQLAAIESVQKTKDGLRFKLHSKTTALEQLGRHFGVYEKDNTQRQPQTIINVHRKGDK